QDSTEVSIPRRRAVTTDGDWFGVPNRAHRGQRALHDRDSVDVQGGLASCRLDTEGQVMPDIRCDFVLGQVKVHVREGVIGLLGNEHLVVGNADGEWNLLVSHHVAFDEDGRGEVVVRCHTIYERCVLEPGLDGQVASYIDLAGIWGFDICGRTVQVQAARQLQ